MRKIIFILTFVFSLLINHYSSVIAQTGWFWQNPIPQGNDLNSVCFVNENTGWAVGIKGTIIKTTDGGSNWVLQQSGINSNLRKVYFLNSNTGFALSDTSRIFMTMNGGLNWTQQLFADNMEFNGIYFINQNTGFLGGFNFLTYRGKIFKTINGGLNWILKYNSNGSDHIKTIQFINNNTGYAGANGWFYKTTDAGENWSQWQYWNGWDFHFLDTMNAIIVGEDKCIYKTTNGGLNFIMIYQSLTSFFISISMLNLNLAYVVGQNGNILKTTNFGDNWTVQQSGTTQELRSVFFVDSLKGWVVGYNGTILKTTNGGINWISVLKGPLTNYSSCSFINSNTGYVSGYNSIVKTTNGGDNWVEKWDSAGNNTNLINFINENTGWGASLECNGSSEPLYKTTNGGNNWSNIGAITINDYYCTQIKIYRIQFLNDLTGWIAGNYHFWFGPSTNIDYGIIWKTTNGGINWTYVRLNTPEYFFDIKLINLNTGWAVGSSSGIFRTTNGGLNWIQQQGPYTSSMMNYKVAPVNENTVYILSYYSNNSNAYISKTMNGGLNWMGQLVCNGVGFYGLNFVNENIGWMCGNNGFMYATSNGGINWCFQQIPSSYLLTNVVFTDENTGWAVGSNGTILKTTSGVISGIRTTIKENSPVSFMLYQNYPNPFNPSTKIKFNIASNVRSQTANVKLIIYDIIGREIKILVNEQLQPGTYEVTFDGSALPSGVYFYKLETGNYTETEKMLLLK